MAPRAAAPGAVSVSPLIEPMAASANRPTLARVGTPVGVQIALKTQVARLTGKVEAAQRLGRARRLIEQQAAIGASLGSMASGSTRIAPESRCRVISAAPVAAVGSRSSCSVAWGSSRPTNASLVSRRLPAVVGRTPVRKDGDIAKVERGRVASWGRCPIGIGIWVCRIWVCRTWICRISAAITRSRLDADAHDG
jgi:hypothetical protein